MYRPVSAARWVALLGMCGSGCATAWPGASFEPGASPGTFVEDRTGPDHDPAFLVGEGNISSCHYGIHHVPKASFSPPKAQAFGALLERHVPGISGRHVVVERYDVYYNARARMLGSAAGFPGGGILASMIRDRLKAGAQAGDRVYAPEDLVLDTDPLQPKSPDAHVIGCDDQREGEYDGSQFSGVDVVVTWVQFTVDGKPYHARSFLAVQPKGKEDMARAVALASEQTFAALAPLIAGGGATATAVAADAPAVPAPRKQARREATTAPPSAEPAQPAAVPMAGELVVHFHHPRADYATAGLATWEVTDGGTRRSVASSSAPLPPTGVDAFGAYWILRAGDYPGGVAACTVLLAGRRDGAGGGRPWGPHAPAPAVAQRGGPAPSPPPGPRGGGVAALRGRGAGPRARRGGPGRPAQAACRGSSASWREACLRRRRSISA
jgi:hypothetical protein